MSKNLFLCEILQIYWIIFLFKLDSLKSCYAMERTNIYPKLLPDVRRLVRIDTFWLNVLLSLISLRVSAI
jgi:hypothetical protein